MNFNPERISDCLAPPGVMVPLMFFRLMRGDARDVSVEVVDPRGGSDGVVVVVVVFASGEGFYGESKSLNHQHWSIHHSYLGSQCEWCLMR